MNTDGLRITVLTLLAAVLFTLQGCGVVKRGTIPWEAQTTAEKTESGDSQQGDTEIEENPVLAMSVSKEPVAMRAVKTGLQRAHKDWKGVPYVLGGAGYDGVDCSSFMQIVFLDYFEIELPRNTREQFEVGNQVRKNQLLAGDLVFFKTGSKTYHVGVMMNEVEFLHASTSSGVMVSSLRNNYWQEVYLTARRVL